MTAEVTIDRENPEGPVMQAVRSPAYLPIFHPIMLPSVIIFLGGLALLLAAHTTHHMVLVGGVIMLPGSIIYCYIVRCCCQAKLRKWNDSEARIRARGRAFFRGTTLTRIMGRSNSRSQSPPGPIRPPPYDLHRAELGQGTGINSIYKMYNRDPPPSYEGLKTTHIAMTTISGTYPGLPPYDVDSGAPTTISPELPPSYPSLYGFPETRVTHL